MRRSSCAVAEHRACFRVGNGPFTTPRWERWHIAYIGRWGSESGSGVGEGVGVGYQSLVHMLLWVTVWTAAGPVAARIIGTRFGRMPVLTVRGVARNS